MKKPVTRRYRWVAPNGRRGRWRKTIEGAVISAVGSRHSGTGLRVQFCAQSSLVLWPSLKEEGWSIEQESRSAR